ncbi:hypothetical protein MBLNU230_g3516t1 [Neophaeotheca triangularis]
MDPTRIPPDPYHALNLSRNSTQAAIKARYYQLAFKYHPNRIQGNADLFNRIQHAWEILGNPDKRRRYHEIVLLQQQQEEVHNKVFKHLGHDSSSDESSVDEDGHDLYPNTRRGREEQAASLSGIRNGGGQTLETSNTIYRSKSRDSGSSRGSTGFNAAADRRKQLDKLRRREIEAYGQYSDAVIAKLEAEEDLEEAREGYEEAKWRREYFQQQPRDTTTRMRLVQSIHMAVKSFRQISPRRPRRSGTVSHKQFLSTGDPFRQGGRNTHLQAESPTSPTARPKHKRGYSSDISGDQTSTEESDNGSSSGRQRWETLLRKNRLRRERGARNRPSSEPPTIKTPVPRNRLKPGPTQEDQGTPEFRFLVKRPTGFDGHSPIDSMADTTPESSRSPSPKPVNTCTAVELMSVLRRFNRWEIQPPPSDWPLPVSQPADEPPEGISDTEARMTIPRPLYKIITPGVPQHQIIPFDKVQLCTPLEKRDMLAVEPDAELPPDTLLEKLAKMDQLAAQSFAVKPDIMDSFKFRLIRTANILAPQRSFIALSYRRNILVRKQGQAYTLPLDPIMFQAVLDERRSESEGLWVDQICIDQASEDEKTLAMSAMEMVYRSARVVVVALDVLLTPHESTILEDHLVEYNRVAPLAHDKPFRGQSPPYLENHEEIYQVLHKLLQSSWFKRAWCRHEMRLAKDHVFLVACEKSAPTGNSAFVRFTGKWLAHLLALAAEVPSDLDVVMLIPALNAFFQDRSRPGSVVPRNNHGNFTTVIAEVFAMGAGGDPSISEELREAAAKKDKMSIILNTMECGLTLAPAIRNPQTNVSTSECFYMLMQLALAARDPGALCSVGHPMSAPYPQDPSHERVPSWLLEPTNVDAGLNNYKTLRRFAPNTLISASFIPSPPSHTLLIDLNFLTQTILKHPTDLPSTMALAQTFLDFCLHHKVGRNRHRYLINDATCNGLFGSMREVYAQTLTCVFECGPDWMESICQRYGVSRWKQDLAAAGYLLVALRNTHHPRGGWPVEHWSKDAAGFLLDFVNFLVVRGMPQRQVTVREEWRPVCVFDASNGGKVVSFAPPARSEGGEVRAAVPRALLDDEYMHLARLWLLEPREQKLGGGWTLLGKSVVFGDERAMRRLHLGLEFSERQSVFGRDA